MIAVKNAKDTVTIADVFEYAGQYIHNPDSIALIQKAYDYVMDKHDGQTRRSGEPYTNHLIWVAYILATLETGPMTIAAGLLHDVMEDCGISHEEMVKEFGEEITTLVEGVTKISKMSFKDEQDVYAENHRKIYIAMAKDIRVILIKFADRLHNMRTLKYMPLEKQQRIAKETLEVYSPIAHRLGINDVRIELEDLSLLYIDPKAYKEIAELLESKRNERKQAVEEMMNEVETLLKENEIDFKILGRAKHIYSIYKKMFIKHKRFDELYDLNALRIITKSKMQCYEILGLIHDHYRPLPGRFKDYIAMPKPNMYQSLHTAVLGVNGLIFEIQIRTEEMDVIAERGLAAHWRYKENKGYSSRNEQKEIGEKLQWLRDFITLSDDIQNSDAKEYYNALKRDIFEANVYVLSPRGKIIELPNGATPIDFAYRIHTEVGHKMTDAFVNNIMVPIDTKLKTGDLVEIKTNKNSPGPSEDWLKIVRTAGARNKIRQFLANKEAETRKDTIEDGRKLLLNEVRHRGLDEKQYADVKTYEPILNSLGANNFDDLLYLIGRKNLLASSVLEKVLPKKESFIDNLNKMLQKNIATNERQKASGSGVAVRGVTGMRMALSKCCNPIPGDDIIGFVSQGQGIKVHRKDCPNVNTEEAKKRLIEVYWDYPSIESKRFEVDLEIVGADRTNLLTDIITTLGALKINILSVHGDVIDMTAKVNLKIAVDSSEQLKLAKANLMKIVGVYEIERVIH
jgi:(p)ppGpp synthetase, RelA/SpoT family